MINSYTQINYEYILFRNSLNPFASDGMSFSRDQGAAIDDFSTSMITLIEASIEVFLSMIFLSKESLMR